MKQARKSPERLPDIFTQNPLSRRLFPRRMKNSTLDFSAFPVTPAAEHGFPNPEPVSSAHEKPSRTRRVSLTALSHPEPLSTCCRHNKPLSGNRLYPPASTINRFAFSRFSFSLAFFGPAVPVQGESGREAKPIRQTDTPFVTAWPPVVKRHPLFIP